MNSKLLFFYCFISLTTSSLSSYFLCCGNIIYTQAPPHIVHGTLLPSCCPCLLCILSASSGFIASSICFCQFRVLLALVIALSHFIALSLIFTKSPA